MQYAVVVKYATLCYPSAFVDNVARFVAQTMLGKGPRPPALGYHVVIKEIDDY